MESHLKQQIDNYKTPAEAIEVVRETPLELLVGISGAGKDTIKQELLKTGAYHHIISHASRAPRENNGVLEQDGIDYHFVSQQEFSEMLDRGEFIEAKMYSGNLYGTSIAEIKKARDMGKIAITDLDIQGVAEYKTISENVIAVFIMPPSYDEWRSRLMSRYGEAGADPDDIAKRTHRAIAELREALDKPYYHFVVNEDLDSAVKSVDSIAHHHDQFTTIDKSFHHWAERLLYELELHLGQ